ncbi:HEXXH motif domain-containing protein, partial [Streptomyces bambusae]|nr:HEXXH motif domain-containing protein [Streptomyces bambusae]
VPARAPGRWTDPRTRLYRTPPTAPAGADAHLAAGNPGTARQLYAETLRHSPGDPHALSGWLLAGAELSPGLRRLLRRPERLAALGPDGPEELGRAAAWLAARA